MNTRDAERTVQAYSVDSRWRNRAEFFLGRAANSSGNRFRAHGNEKWEFNGEGLMRRREASINDVPIREAETRLHRASQQLRETLGDGLSGAFEGVFPFGGMRCDQVIQAVIARIAVTAAATQDCAVEMIGRVP